MMSSYTARTSGVAASYSIGSRLALIRAPVDTGLLVQT
jgi:hypothetical protein